MNDKFLDRIAKTAGNASSVLRQIQKEADDLSMAIKALETTHEALKMCGLEADADLVRKTIDQILTTLSQQMYVLGLLARELEQVVFDIYEPTPLPGEAPSDDKSKGTGRWYPYPPSKLY